MGDRMKWAMVAVACCAALTASAADNKPIHPKVFEMILSWISDMGSPVATEVSLTAMRRNNDQFQYNHVTMADGMVKWAEGGVQKTGIFGPPSMWYRLESLGKMKYRSHFFSNGGGSFTRYAKIDFTIGTKTLSIDGKVDVEVEVLTVVGVDGRLE